MKGRLHTIAFLGAFAWSVGAYCASSPRVNPATTIHRYNLPAGEAADSLREFARVSHLQLLFPERAVRGLRLPPLRGEFSIRDGLDRLLEDSGLEAVHNKGTGAYAVRPGFRPTISTKAEVELPVTPTPAIHHQPTEAPVLEMPPVRIEQRRNFGLTTQSILRADRAAPLYHHVANRADIEQAGVTNMAEFVTTLPGYSGEGAEALQATADFTFLGGANVYTGSFLKLRGWDAHHTTVLLNGRQLPASPESRGPDLSRVPLAAVERIEVLPFAGSAIYGEGAVGGAMNIVLRKDFSGQSLSVQTGDSTRGGGRELFFTWIAGLSSASGRTRATIISDYQQRGTLRLGDRDFLSRALTRLPPAKLLPSSGTLGPDLRGLLIAELVGYPAVFAATSTNVDLGMAAHSGAQFALVPNGSNAALLEPGSFLHTDPTLVQSRRQERVVLRRPTQSFNLNMQWEHAIAPNSFELYGEFGYARADERFFAPDAIEPLAISAFDQRNPFRSEVTPGFVGRNVMLYFDPVDLPDARFRQIRDSARAVLGARGAIGHRWNWVIDGFVDWSRSKAAVRSYGSSLNELMRAVPRVGWERLTAVYDPLADHRESPVAIETRERYLARNSRLDYRSRMAGADFRVRGDAAELPAGPLRIALGAEYAWRDLETEQQVEASQELYGLIGANNVFQSLTQLRANADRGHRIGGVAEAVVPLVHGKKRGMLLQSAELNFASRIVRTDEGRSTTSSLAAFKLAPSSTWAMRGTFSQGHVTPMTALLHGPISEAIITVGVRDPRRGGGQHVYPLKVIQGGESTPRTETSAARVLGLLFSPGAVPGLFVSIDAWSITMNDRLRVPSIQEVIDHGEFFPERITRGAPLPFEFLLGWAGPVTSVDVQPVHVTHLRASGVDLGFRYRLRPLRAGTFTLNGQVEIVNRYDEQFLPTTLPVDKVDVVAGASSGGLMESAVVSPRARAALGWQRKAWSASIGMTYNPPYRSETTTPTPALPGATGVDGDFIGSSIRWDLQLGYAVAAKSGNGPRAWMSDTMWTLGVRNLLDSQPPYRSDGTSFYSRFDDPRMRFIYLRAQWRR